MLIGNLKEMIGRAVGAVPTEEAEPDLDKPFVIPNRAQLRHNRRSHYKRVAERRYNKSRSRTGQPDWFRGMKVRAAVKATLEKVPTVHAWPGPHDGEPASELEALSGAGFKSVWDLSQAKREDLLAVKGIGPAKLKKIRAALVSRSVPVAWKAE